MEGKEREKCTTGKQKEDISIKWDLRELSKALLN